jgi:medium-chain acyl-[acyl-carrier-protein] hydrolase
MLVEGVANEKKSVWLPPLRTSARSQLRLFCFPYAGGSASAFARWPDFLPATVDVRPVQLPGRWNRMREAPFTRFEHALRVLAQVLPPFLDRPFVFFGHSMGALLAFEMARYLQQQGLPQPLHLFVSGRRAPHLPDTDLPPAGLNDEEFIERLRELNGTPGEVLGNPELMNLLLPTIRADFDVCRSHEYIAGPPLACPLTVFGGIDDVESAGDRLEAWDVHTTGRRMIFKFPGDHFYMHSAEASLLRTLAASLRSLVTDDSLRLQATGFGLQA